MQTGLPDRVVLAIFQHCLDTPAIIPPPPGDERVALMSACRQWRSLIASSPEFWVGVIFLPVASRQLPQLASVWLHRTAGVPVSIVFDSDFSRYHRGAEATHARQLIYGAGEFCVIQSIILPCIERIISLTCTLATDRTIRAFFTIPPGRFLSLRRLEVSLINQLNNQRSSFNHWELADFAVFRDIPSLRTVKAHLLNGIDPHYLGLPWGQLTTLDFGSTPMSPETFLCIVRMSRSSLIVGRFRIESTGQPASLRNGRPASHSREPPPFKPLTANTLQDLHLIVIEPGEDQRIFKALRLPALTCLSIEVDDANESWDLDLYIPLLSKAPCLEYFSFDCYQPRLQIRGTSQTALLRQNLVPNEQMERFLSAIPTTQSLRLGLGLNIYSPTLQKLACGKLLPELEALECGSVDGLSILSMVSRRNDASDNILQQPSIATSSQPQPQPPSLHKSILLLHLLVPEDDLAEVRAEAETILQYQSATDIEILIDGMNPRLFY